MKRLLKGVNYGRQSVGRAATAAKSLSGLKANAISASGRGLRRR